MNCRVRFLRFVCRVFGAVLNRRAETRAERRRSTVGVLSNWAGSPCHLRICLPFIVLLFYPRTHAQSQEYDADAEISRTKRELARIESQRKEVAEASARDKEEFAHYTTRTQQQLETLAAQTDSVLRQSAQLSRTNDSLGAKLGAIEARTREFTLHQERFRTKIVDLCQQQIVLAHTLPPAIAEQSISALSFLKSEISSKSIDNIEAMSRLITMLNGMETQCMDIQVLQGPSPIPDIAGTAYRLRIGGVFEAVVDAKGQSCAVWSGEDESSWTLSNDSELAGRILKALHIREGKTVPAMVKLPFVAREKEADHE